MRRQFALANLVLFPTGATVARKSCAVNQLAGGAVRRSRRVRRALLAFIALTTASFAFAQDAREDEPTGPSSSRRDEPLSPVRDDPAGRATESWEFTDEQRKAIEHGLSVLAHRQQSAGFWRAENGRWDVAVTALCGLAFLGHGDQPGRSGACHPDDKITHGDRIERAVRWLLKQQWPDNDPSGAGGLIYDRRDSSDDKQDRPMHGHGYAMLFLAEAYGQTRDRELSDKLKTGLMRAVALTERTQSREGGWFYRPNDNKDEGSVTITQIQGLRAAHNVGIKVSKTTIDRAVDYIRRSQLKTGDRAGGVRYTIHWGDPSPALTAAGIAVFYGAGEYGSPGIQKGFEYLARNMRLNDKAHFWNYTHLYAVQAMYQRGMPEWKDYYTKLRQQLLGPGARTAEGDWADAQVGRNFGTAVAVLCLEVPLCYLPIFQR